MRSSLAPLAKEKKVLSDGPRKGCYSSIDSVLLFSYISFFKHSECSFFLSEEKLLYSLFLTFIKQVSPDKLLVLYLGDAGTNMHLFCSG